VETETLARISRIRIRVGIKTSSRPRADDRLPDKLQTGVVAGVSIPTYPSFTGRILPGSAAVFVKGVDYTDFAPIRSLPSTNLTGGTLGNSRQVLAWFRDTKCTAPTWPTRPLEGETVAIDAKHSFLERSVCGPVLGQGGRHAPRYGKRRPTPIEIAEV